MKNTLRSVQRTNPPDARKDTNVDNNKKKSYAEMLIGMSTDFILEKIKWETYVSNVNLISRQLQADVNNQRKPEVK